MSGGVSPDGDRATHEPSPDGLGHAVSVPNAIYETECSEIHYAESLVLRWLGDALDYGIVNGGERAKSFAWDVNYKFKSLMRGEAA